MHPSFLDSYGMCMIFRTLVTALSLGFHNKPVTMCGSSISSTPSLEANSLNGNAILELLKELCGRTSTWKHGTYLKNNDFYSKAMRADNVPQPPLSLHCWDRGSMLSLMELSGDQ